MQIVVAVKEPSHGISTESWSNKLVFHGSLPGKRHLHHKEKRHEYTEKAPLVLPCVLLELVTKTGPETVSYIF